MRLGLKSAGCDHVHFGDHLFAPRSICVGALLELLGGSLVALSPKVCFL